MAEFEINGTSKTFAEKYEALDADKKATVDAIKGALLAKKKVHERISKKCATYNLGRKAIAKISIIGKSIRLHLALDPASEELSKYPLKDLSDKKSYADVPAMLRISSDLALRRALKLIELL